MNLAAAVATGPLSAIVMPLVEELYGYTIVLKSPKLPSSVRSRVLDSIYGASTQQQLAGKRGSRPLLPDDLAVSLW